MGSGYVLDFSDRTYGEFFRRHNVDIHGFMYLTFGTSKAKKLRAFWRLAPDKQAGTVLSELLDHYEAICEVNGEPKDSVLLKKARAATRRLTGHSTEVGFSRSGRELLDQEFILPSIQKLPLEPQVGQIVEARLNEVRVALGAGAYLSVVLLCGSVLESVLLGAAQQNHARFSRAKAAPKSRYGSAKRLHEWSLGQLIDVSYEVGILNLYISKFSDPLRGFRRYLHPYQQLASGFTPDELTARVCFQVLKAALASVAQAC